MLAPRNTVRVAYRSSYDHIGAGLHQFTDPEDGAEYLYTHFGAVRRAPPAALLRPARPEGHAPPRGDRAGGMASRRQLPGRVVRAAGRRAHAPPLRRDAADQHLPARARGRALRALRRPVGGRRAGRALPRLDRAALRCGRVLPGDAAGADLLQRLLRFPLPVRQVRPGLRAGVQHGRDGERGLHHVLGADDLPATRRRTSSG